MTGDERPQALAALARWRAAELAAEHVARLRARYGPLGAPMRRASRAVRALREALPQLWAASGAIARRDGVGRAAQAWHLWRLLSRFPLMMPREFYLHRFYEPARRARAGLFIYRLWNTTLLRRLGPPHATDWPKLDFRRACRERGLASIPVLGVFRDGALALEEGPGPEAGGWAGDLYVKPEGGSKGRGVALWPADRPRAQLIERYRRASAEEPYIVQPRIRNHAELEPLSNGLISSLRVMTCRAPDGGVKLLLPALKISIGPAVTDHFRAGNIAAPVDPGTGRLGLGRSYDERSVVHEHETHPDTGARIPGRGVPLWRETVELCLRAQASFPELVVCAWDVAVTPDGPVIIEGNRFFGVELVQVACDQPLGVTDYPAAVWAHVQRRLLPSSAAVPD